MHSTTDLDGRTNNDAAAVAPVKSRSQARTFLAGWGDDSPPLKTMTSGCPRHAYRAEDSDGTRHGQGSFWRAELLGYNVHEPDTHLVLRSLSPHEVLGLQLLSVDNGLVLCAVVPMTLNAQLSALFENNGLG